MTLDSTLIAAATAAAVAFGKGILGGAAKDAWTKIKSLIAGKDEKAVGTALEAVEAKPESDGRKAVLSEELAESEFATDEQFVALLGELKAALDADTNPEIQNIIGNTIVNTGSGSLVMGNDNVTGGAGSTISVNPDS